MMHAILYSLMELAGLAVLVTGLVMMAVGACTKSKQTKRVGGIIAIVGTFLLIALIIYLSLQGIHFFDGGGVPGPVL